MTKLVNAMPNMSDTAELSYNVTLKVWSKSIGIGKLLL